MIDAFVVNGWFFIAYGISPSLQKQEHTEAVQEKCGNLPACTNAQVADIKYIPMPIITAL